MDKGWIEGDKLISAKISNAKKTGVKKCRASFAHGFSFCRNDCYMLAIEDNGRTKHDMNNKNCFMRLFFCMPKKSSIGFQGQKKKRKTSFSSNSSPIQTLTVGAGFTPAPPN